MALFMFIARESQDISADLRNHAKSYLNLADLYSNICSHVCRLQDKPNPHRHWEILVHTISLFEKGLFISNLSFEAKHQPDISSISKNPNPKSQTSAVYPSIRRHWCRNLHEALIFSNADDQSVSKKANPNLISLVPDLLHDQLCSDSQTKSSLGGSEQRRPAHLDCHRSATLSRECWLRLFLVWEKNFWIRLSLAIWTKQDLRMFCWPPAPSCNSVWKGVSRLDMKWNQSKMYASASYLYPGQGSDNFISLLILERALNGFKLDQKLRAQLWSWIHIGKNFIHFYTFTLHWMRC